MASSGARSTTSHVLFLLLLAAFAAGASAAPLTITNHCSYTVWPAVVPVGRGIELRPSANWTLDVPSGSDIWGRTGCSFDKGGRGSCQTGECGGLQCASGSSSSPAVTKAELSVYQGSYYYGITTLNGFNLPLDFSCSSGDALRCREAGCHVAYPYQKYYQHMCGASGSQLQVVFCP
ncbi:thaumatin-like pathogenesis-related protein 4 [Lolium rigidum]|uniref:thaumatin-like pathogenesis-related protein 4 n=1 Tax=Lolium rigidum TaxID=89674 RepID=UPI001F5C58CE|nr:thaumatin-like pathogenesis-related protein 4 [Lolium rigidum]